MFESKREKKMEGCLNKKRKGREGGRENERIVCFEPKRNEKKEKEEKRNVQ